MIPFLLLFCTLFNCILAILGLFLMIGGVGACSNPANGNTGVWIFFTGIALCMIAFKPFWW